MPAVMTTLHLAWYQRDNVFRKAFCNEFCTSCSDQKSSHNMTKISNMSIDWQLHELFQVRSE